MDDRITNPPPSNGEASADLLPGDHDGYDYLDAYDQDQLACAFNRASAACEEHMGTMLACLRRMRCIPAETAIMEHATTLMKSVFS